MVVSLRHNSQHIVDRQRKQEGAGPLLHKAPEPVKRPFVGNPNPNFWTVSAIDTLVSMAARKHTAAEIGAAVGRTASSVANKAHKLGISLRREKPGPRPRRRQAA